MPLPVGELGQKSINQVSLPFKKQLGIQKTN